MTENMGTPEQVAGYSEMQVPAAALLKAAAAFARVPGVAQVGEDGPSGPTPSRPSRQP